MKRAPKLPEAELDVMLALWEFTQPARTACILEKVQARRAWTVSTLKVVLGRLVEKGFVEETRQGRFTLCRKKSTAAVRQSICWGAFTAIL